MHCSHRRSLHRHTLIASALVGLLLIALPLAADLCEIAHDADPLALLDRQIPSYELLAPFLLHGNLAFDRNVQDAYRSFLEEQGMDPDLATLQALPWVFLQGTPQTPTASQALPQKTFRDPIPHEATIGTIHSLGTLKALRPAPSASEWEYLEAGQMGEWIPNGTFHVLETIPLERSPSTGQLYSHIENLNVSMVLGEFQRHYVLALLIDNGFELEDQYGVSVQPIFEIERSPSLNVLIDIALEISEASRGQAPDLSPLEETSNEGIERPYFKCDCTEDCYSEHKRDVRSCNIDFSLCSVQVTALSLACLAACPATGPLAVTCVAACVASDIAGLARCTRITRGCKRDAARERDQCLAGCVSQCQGGSGGGGGDGGGGGGGSGSGSCTIAAGEVCPPSCFQCTVDPFL